MRYQRISATWQSVIGLWRRGLVVREGASATRALHPLPSATPVQSDIPTFHPFNPMSYRHAMGKRLLTALRIMKFCPLPLPQCLETFPDMNTVSCLVSGQMSHGRYRIKCFIYVQNTWQHEYIISNKLDQAQEERYINHFYSEVLNSLILLSFT